MAGNYEFARVAPGHYQLLVVKPGFRSNVVEDAEIAVNETTTADSNLSIGQVSETIIVADVPSIVQTDRSSIAGLDVSKIKTKPRGGAVPPPAGRPRAQVKERVGRATLFSFRDEFRPAIP